MDSKKQVLDMVERQLARSGAMHKFVSTGEWMALFILSPSSNARSGPHVSNAASSCSHVSSTRQTTRESSQEALGQALYHGSPIYHTQDTEALLGFSRHLLLDVVFDLWTFTDSLAEYRNVEDDSTPASQSETDSNAP